MKVLTRLQEHMHPLMRWPESIGEWLAFAVFVGCLLMLLVHGFRTGRIALSGMMMAIVGQLSMTYFAQMIGDTPLWIPAFMIPGGLAAVLMYGLIGLLGRTFGVDEMTRGTKLVLAVVTALLGVAITVAMFWLFVSQNTPLLAAVGLIALFLGLVIQMILVRTSKNFHNYDELYDMPLIIEPGLTAEELWGKGDEDE